MHALRMVNGLVIIEFNPSPLSYNSCEGSDVYNNFQDHRPYEMQTSPVLDPKEFLSNILRTSIELHVSY